MPKTQLPKTPEELQGKAASFFNTIKAESDRGCVLVASAFLDEALELMLRFRMSSDPKIIKVSVDPFFKGIGPLKSFWAKTELCRVLSFITEEEYADLSGIRNLRNHFAHSYVNASFLDVEAEKVVAKLFHFGIEQFPLTDVEKEKGNYVRNRFCLAASWLAGGFHKRSGVSA